MGPLARLLPWLFYALATAGAAAAPLPTAVAEAAPSVLRLKVIGADGTVVFGSGVVIASGRVATTCHVTRGARAVEISEASPASARWSANGQVGSVYHDLCVLSVPDLPVRPVATRSSSDLHLHDRVYAIGFPGGGEVTATDGAVEGLYPYDGGNVIRTSARFDFGASGGALFDDTGRLIGLLAFKARTGDALRFALPADWVRSGGAVASCLCPIADNKERAAFWEGTNVTQPLFLRAALAEATAHR